MKLRLREGSKPGLEPGCAHDSLRLFFTQDYPDACLLNSKVTYVRQEKKSFPSLWDCYINNNGVGNNIVGVIKSQAVWRFFSVF